MLSIDTAQTLSSLRQGQSARVRSLRASGSMRRRFQDLGLIEGTLVECLGRAPLGDPCAYLIRGAVIALRKCDADAIAVEALPAPCPAMIPSAVMPAE